MFSLTVKNKYGKEMDLTQNPSYCVYDIDGLSPPDATINTTKTVATDGSLFNSSYLNNRQIIITMTIESPTEDGRTKLYDFFQSKAPVTLFFENEIYDVRIDGFVQNTAIGFFQKKQTAQITVVCPDPYFRDVKTEHVILKNVDDMFEFPFDITNEGIEFSRISEEAKTVINKSQVEVGAVFNIFAKKNMENPRITLQESSEFIGFLISMEAGQRLSVCTIPKKKKAVLIDANGEESNAIGSLMEGSAWLKLRPGLNTFTLSSDDFYADIEFNELYQGV